MALFVDQYLGTDYAKMAYGIMRYKPEAVICALDKRYDGQNVKDVTNEPFNVPIVNKIKKAIALGANTLVLGIAPSGGKLPEEWSQPITEALENGLSVWNGLHQKLENQFGHLVCNPGQRIWDIRTPDFIPDVGRARAAKLTNTRVLMIGTDMAIGKMTAGLEIYRELIEGGHNVDFLATGQIGITITGKGIPLDAFIVDQACGAVEKIVLDASEKDIVIVEGQGSLMHPGSTATLPLMRGSCPTHLILCHKAGKTHLRNPSDMEIPNLKDFIRLNELVATSCGALPKAKCIGVALNTSMLSEGEANDEIRKLENELQLPVTDVVRYGSKKLIDALINC